MRSQGPAISKRLNVLSSSKIRIKSRCHSHLWHLCMDNIVRDAYVKRAEVWAFHEGRKSGAFKGVAERRKLREYDSSTTWLAEVDKG